MNPISLFKYPAYRCNPKQILDRCVRSLRRPKSREVVRLPWGHCMQVNPHEFIGRAIWAQGVHEISVCEAIARCTESGQAAIDVGANVGFMTSLMSHCVGPGGHVMAFEPHPVVFDELAANAERFRARSMARIDVHQMALGSEEGYATLECDDAALQENAGTARIRTGSGAHEADNCGRKWVRVRPLDALIQGERVSLVKIDVEGGELDVLKGARQALQEGRIRTIVYEDFDFASSGIAQFLEYYGFSVFHLERSTWGPRIVAAGSDFQQVLSGSDENFVATLDASRIERLYSIKGWRLFRL